MGWVDVAQVINSFSKHISTFSRTVSKILFNLFLIKLQRLMNKSYKTADINKDFDLILTTYFMSE